MTARDLVLDALQRKPVDRVPWVPFVGVHGGALIGVDATTYLQSADHIVAGLLAARERYRPDGLPIAFDLQIEAEILGCDLAWADDGPPSVTGHPLAGGRHTEPLPPFSVDAGRMPVVLEATRRLRAAVGDEIALYGLVCGPFTLAMHLAGSELFLTMYDDLDAVAELVQRCAAVTTTAAEAYVAAGADVVAIVDPMVSQIGADHFAHLVAPAVDRVADAVHAAGALVSLFVCGDATRNLEAMAQTRCDNISIDENIDLGKLATIGAEHGTSIGGNLKLTLALLLGSEADVTRDVLRAYQEGGETGFILAPGCDLPYAVPPGNLERVATLVHDGYQRDVAAATLGEAAEADAFDDVAIPDYPSLSEVVVDCITLDSATCPPCFYMVDVARRAARKIGEERVVVREHKVTGRDGLGYMTKLGVGNVPSICIEGAVRHASLIPSVDALASEVAEALRCKHG